MFVVCGEALWDLFARETAAGLSFEGRMGGSPFNTAIGLARLGQKTALMTGLSSDGLGKRLAATLRSENVCTDLIVSKHLRTTLSLVELGPEGTPEYAFYGEGAADRAITLSDLPEFGPEVWGVHAGSFSLVAEPVGASLMALLRRESGRRLVTLDPNVRLNAEPDVDLWRSRIEALVALSDVVKISDEDLAILAPGGEPRTVAARWLEAGASLVVVTRGPEGAEAFSRDGSLSVPGRRVDVVDTVGAGDSFMSALIAGLAERGARDRRAVGDLGEDARASLLTFAVEAASITCGRLGANPPRRNELQEAGV